MSPTSPDDVLAALREFATRIDALDPGGAAVCGRRGAGGQA